MKDVERILMDLDRTTTVLLFFFFPSSLACIMKRNKLVGCYLVSLPCNRKNIFPVYTIGLRVFREFILRGNVIVCFLGEGREREKREKDEFKLEINTDIDRSDVFNGITYSTLDIFTSEMLVVIIKRIEAKA